jgi:hypothetical protein
VPPPTSIRQYLHKLGIGLEVMDTVSGWMHVPLHCRLRCSSEMHAQPTIYLLRKDDV